MKQQFARDRLAAGIFNDAMGTVPIRQCIDLPGDDTARQTMGFLRGHLVKWYAPL